MKRFISFSLACVMIFSWSCVSGAETLQEVKDMKNEVDKKINDLAEQKKKQTDSLKAAEEEKNKLLDDKNKFSTVKNRLLEDKQKQDDKKRSLEDEIGNAKKDYDNALRTFKARARAMYVNSNKSELDILVNSQSLVELTSKIFILNNIAKKDREITQNLKTTKQDLDFKKSHVEMEIAQLKKKIDQTNSTLNNINSNQAELTNKIDNINDKMKKIEMEEDEFLQESENLTNKIKLFGKSGRKYIGGKMLWPTPSCYDITSPFGPRMHPVLGYSRMHTGIDIGAGYGASILAANDGVVKLAGWSGGYGNAVIIDHGGEITSLYGHCSSVLVNEEQKVKCGEIIAKVGSTGMSTGPHLHFEVRSNGEPVDPLNYLGK